MDPWSIVNTRRNSREEKKDTIRIEVLLVIFFLFDNFLRLLCLGSYFRFLGSGCWFRRRRSLQRSSGNTLGATEALPTLRFLVTSSASSSSSSSCTSAIASV